MEMKKTKIVATIGPATESEENLRKLIGAGLNIFRLNLKHNTHEWHLNVLSTIRKISAELEFPVGVIADLQGPEMRIGAFDTPDGKIDLNEGEIIYFGKHAENNLKLIPFNYLNLISGIKHGSKIFIDDGKVELEVIEVGQGTLKTKVLNGNVLGSKKSISFPDARVEVPTLNEKDRKDVEFVVANDFDFVALSFVRDGNDITTLRKLIEKLGGHQKIIAKVETLSAIENITEIIDESDVIMVARGDLGVEIPIEKVPRIQKQLILECRHKYKPVIVATQMLLSMVKNPLPTRAEVADVANAVFDKADAVMLSEETTVGEHPIRTVSMMSKIARYNEHLYLTENFEIDPKSFEEMIISSSVNLSHEKIQNEAKIVGYLVFTESGKSARLLSRYRSTLPVFAFTQHKEVVNRLCMSYGVQPFYLKLSQNPVTNTKRAIEILKSRRRVETGDKVIVVFGNDVGEPEGNNTLSIITVN